MKKLQTQVLSLIIMAGIIMGLVGVAYIWGAPMIEKRTVYTQYTSAAKFVSDLNDKITSIASTCTTPGGCTYTMDIPGIESSVIIFDNAQNTLYYKFPSKQKMLTEDEIAINTPYTGEPADYGTAPPGVIKASGNNEGDTYVIQFALKYRKLIDQESGVGYRIAINGQASGRNKVIISYGGTVQDADGTTVSSIDLNVI